MKKREGQTRGLIPLSERSPEERQAIVQKGVQARKKKKEERMMLQACMKELLGMRVNSSKRKDTLKKYGFEDDEMNNKALLMVALFQKGISGDVGAIKEITSMMDKLDLYESTGRIQPNIIINLTSEDEGFTMSDEVMEEIREAEEEEGY